MKKLFSFHLCHILNTYNLLSWENIKFKNVCLAPRGVAKADCIIPHRKTHIHSEHHISGIQYHNQLENVYHLTHLRIILRNDFFITNNVNINVNYLS